MVDLVSMLASAYPEIMLEILIAVEAYAKHGCCGSVEFRHSGEYFEWSLEETHRLEDPVVPRGISLEHRWPFSDRGKRNRMVSL